MKKIFMIAIVAVTMMSSCTSYTATGAMFGGLAGSAVGGIMGGPRGSDVGALVGMATGAVMGAAAEAQEEARYERARTRAYDDVYYDNSGSYRDVEKAKRIQGYHNKVKYQGTGSRGYGNARSSYGNNGSSYNNGYRFETGTDPMAGSNAKVTDVQQNTENSGFTSDSKYDDRIEMK